MVCDPIFRSALPGTRPGWLLLFLLCCLLLFLAAQTPLGAATDSSGAPPLKYWLEIDKSDRLVRLMSPSGHLRSYQASFGKSGAGLKLLRGDLKTPEGIYWIREIRPSKRFHRFLHLNYPNRMDAWRGFRTKQISTRQYQAIMQAHKENRLPPQDTPLGGQIGLHGTGYTKWANRNFLKLFNWTQGCIALTNREIDELESYLREGTRVVIRP